MDWIVANAGNILALLFVIACIACALWGILHKGASDCCSCAGDCGACGGSCKHPKLSLSKGQLTQLDELDRAARAEALSDAHRG